MMSSAPLPRCFWSSASSSGIPWRVTLHACSDQGCLVRFEKSGKGGRLFHSITNLPSGIRWLAASCFPASG
jgi:hypothetical protein